MNTLYYNPETKVVFGSDGNQADPVEAITGDQVADLIANGATVDPSADLLMKKPDPIDQVMLDVHPEEAGNDVAGSPSSVVNAASDANSGNSEQTGSVSTLETAGKGSLEQRVSDLEHALVNLPHSIAVVLSRGSKEAHEFAKEVVEHLFGHEK